VSIQELIPQKKQGVADRLSAQISHHSAVKISFSDVFDFLARLFSPGQELEQSNRNLIFAPYKMILISQTHSF
jgi:hypothetical protein